MQTNNKQTNRIYDYFESSNISSYLGLAAILIAIYADRLEKKEEVQQNVNKTKDPMSNISSDDLTLISIILVGIANLIELGLSKIELDKVLKSNGTLHPLHTKSATTLLISRVFSIVAIIFLLISESLSREAEEAVPTSGPTLSGTINI